MIGTAKSVELTTTAAKADATVFTSPPSSWVIQQALNAAASVKLSLWWMNNYYAQKLCDNQNVYLSLYSGRNANQRFDMYALMTQDDIKIAQNALTSEDLSFDVVGQPIFTAS
jgi:hypothetical protein